MEQAENAEKQLHTMNINDIKPFRPSLFHLSNENNHKRFKDDLYYCISKLLDSYSSLRQTCQSHNTMVNSYIVCN